MTSIEHYRSRWDRKVIAVGACLAFGAIVRFLFIEDNRLLGQDFSQVWVAGRLALEGRVGSLFSVDEFTQAARRLLPESYPVSAWSYPPTTLLPAVIFGWCPYLVALALWTALKAASLCVTLQHA